jgi:YesN/AraC family two-component response regulator
MYYEINGNILPQVRLVDRAVLEPPYVHRKRKADEYILYIMKKGILYLQENGINYELNAGDVLLLDPDFVHRGLKASNCEYYYIHFRHPNTIRRQENPEFMELCMEIRSESLQEDSGSHKIYQNSWLRLPKFVSLRNGNSYLQVIKLVQEAMDQNRNQMENYKVSCACRIMEAFVEIVREAVSSKALKQIPGIPRSYQNIHELLNYLNANYYREISGNLIEETFSCNFDYLNRVFKKNIGKTIFVYLNEIRIHHAKELIATTSMKIMAIGYRVGFQDECYFSKVFKKYTGMSPGQYEKLTSHIEVEKTVALH